MSKIITIKYDPIKNKLRALADDGRNGALWVQFPEEYRTKEGDQYEVADEDLRYAVTKNGAKFYRCLDKHPRKITTAQNTKNINTTIEPEEKSSTAHKEWKQRDFSMFEDFNELNRYEVYDKFDNLLNVFDDEGEAINFAIRNDASYVDFPGAETANPERVWSNDGDPWEECEFCHEYYPIDELISTNLGDICAHCRAAIKSHGESITVYENLDDTISEYFK